METIFKLIGCFIVSAIILACPVLTGFSYALHWPDYVTFILTVITLSILCTLALTLYENS